MVSNSYMYSTRPWINSTFTHQLIGFYVFLFVIRDHQMRITQKCGIAYSQHHLYIMSH